MNITPQRMTNESQEEYRARRASENEAVKLYLYGPKVSACDLLGRFFMVRRKPLSTRPSRRSHPRMGKAALKELKRARHTNHPAS